MIQKSRESVNTEIQQSEIAVDSISGVKSNEIKVSVIIPVYNAEKTIKRCLNSVLEQSMTAIEVICVDDCSQDDTYTILQEYSQKDSRVKILRNEVNLRAGRSRNRGMEIAQGEYLHFLDADDYLVSDALEKLYKDAHENDLDFIKAGSTALDYTTGQIVKAPVYDFSYIAETDFGVVTNFFKNPSLFGKVAVVPWNGIYKRSFLISNNIKFNHLIACNDRSFYAELKAKANRAMLVNYNILYHYVNNPDSLVGIRFNHFSIHFDSYKIIENAVSEIPDEYKYRILVAELDDLVSWLDGAVFTVKDDAVLSDILEQTKAFFGGLDISFFEQTAKQLNINLNTKWYYRYCEMKILSERYPQRNFLPMVSVIVTVYNGEKYLEQCLETLRSQIYKNIEIICIDYGSKDSSISILNEFEKNDERIKVYTQKKKGAGAAKNLGLSLAMGDYIIFVDGNDYFDSKMLSESVHKAIMVDSDITAFASKTKDAVTEEINNPNCGIKSENVPDKDILLFSEIAEDSFSSFTWIAWDKLYKRSFLVDNRLHFSEQQTTNDMYFVLFSFLSAKRISLIDKPLYTHRINIPESLQTTAENSWKYLYDDLINIRETMMRMGVYEKYRCHFINYALNQCICLISTLDDETVKEFLLVLKNEWLEEFEILNYGSGFYKNKLDYEQLAAIWKASSIASEGDILWESYKINILMRENAYLNSSYREINIGNDETMTEKKLIDTLQWNRGKRSALENKIKFLESQAVSSETRYKEILNQLDNANCEIDAIRNSLSFRVGRFVTWFPRKIRELFRKH